MSQTSGRLIDFPRVEGSTSDVNAQSPQEPQADQTTADAVCQARHRRHSVAQNPLLNYPLGKINRSTLPSQVIRFSGQKLRSLIPDCCRISLRGNRRSQLFDPFALLVRNEAVIGRRPQLAFARFPLMLLLPVAGMAIFLVPA